MPIPKPNSGESHKEFMGRCMANPTMNSEFPAADQRYAVCQRSWEKTKEKSMKPTQPEKPQKIEISKDKMYRKLLPDVTFSIDAASLKDRQIRVKAASGKTDRTGDIVKVDGIDLTAYMKNPIVLWGHDHYGLPVAKAVQIEKGSSLDMVFQFPTKEEYAFADTVYKLVKGKYINGVSIGARVKEAEWITDTDGRVIGRKFISLELLEVSIVPIPADSKALITAVKSGAASIEDVEECISKTFEAPLDLFTQNPVDITTYSLSITSGSTPLGSETTEEEEDMSKFEDQLKALTDRVTAIEELAKTSAQVQGQATKSLEALNGLMSNLSTALVTRTAPNIQNVSETISALPLDKEVAKKVSEIMDTIQKKFSAPR